MPIRQVYQQPETASEIYVMKWVSVIKTRFYYLIRSNSNWEMETPKTTVLHFWRDKFKSNKCKK